MKKNLATYGAIVLISAGIAWHFCYNQTYSNFWHNQMARAGTFFNGDAGDPEQYRFVQYLMLAGSLLLFRLVFSTVHLHWVYWLSHWLCLCAVFVALWQYYGRWGIKQRWVALALSAYFVVFAHSKSGYASGTYLEVGLFAWGLVAIWDDRWLAVLLLSFFGSFNRETIALLPIVGFLYAKTDDRRAKYIICLGAALAVQMLARTFLPQSHMTACAKGAVQGLGLAWQNLTDGLALLFLLGFVGFLIPAWKPLPKAHWPLYVFVGMQVLIHIFLGNMPEVRLLLASATLVLVPGALLAATDTPPDSP